MQQLLEVVGWNAGHGLFPRDGSFVHHVAGDLDRRLAAALPAASLQHVEPTALDGELHVLNVTEMPLERDRHLLEFAEHSRHLFPQRGDGFRVSDAGDDILALGVD